MIIRADKKFVSLKKLKHINKLSRVGFYTFDTETKDGLVGKKLFCWGLAYRQQGGLNQLTTLQGYEDLTPLFDKLFNWNHKHDARVVWVHNLTFDARFLIEYLAKHGIKFFPVLSNSNLLALSIDDYNIKFIDSFQFLRSSQEAAEIDYNVDAELRKIDCKDLFEKKFEDWSKEDKKRVYNHNRNDVLALWQVMNEFRKIMFEIGNTDILRSISLGNLALKSQRKLLDNEMINPFVFRKYNPKKNRFYLDYDDLAERFVRESYYGGRCELFTLSEKKDVMYYDGVSFYPSGMVKNYYPYGVPDWYQDLKEDKKELMDIIEGKNDRLAIISVKVIKVNNKENYPIIPKHINKRVCFTNCKLTGVYTSAELQYAYKMGYRFDLNPITIQSNRNGEKVSNVCGLIWPDTVSYFIDFVGKYFKLKKKSKGGKREGAKRLLNSGYGKYGQAFDRKGVMYEYFIKEEDCLRYMDNHENPEILQVYHHTGNRLWIVQEMIEQEVIKPFMNVAIATFVTSYCRIDLHKQIKEAEKLKLDVYYCDSDSVATDNSNLMPEGYGLGDWNKEMVMDRVKFLAPKAYIYHVNDEWKEKLGLDWNWNLKLKGVNRSKRDEIVKEVNENGLDMKEFENILREPIEMAERYMNYKESHRSGLLINSKTPMKHYDFMNLKRDFNKKTGKSKPWTDKTLPKDLIPELSYLKCCEYIEIEEIMEEKIENSIEKYEEFRIDEQIEYDAKFL